MLGYMTNNENYHFGILYFDDFVDESSLFLFKEEINKNIDLLTKIKANTSTSWGRAEIEFKLARMRQIQARLENYDRQNS